LMISALGFLDIISAIMLVVMAVTLWKIPLIIKVLKINGYLKKFNISFMHFTELDKVKLKKAETKTFMGMHGVIIFSFMCWILDIPLLLIKILVWLVCPWRLYISTYTSERSRIPQKFSFKAAFKQEGFVDVLFSVLYLFLDYATFIEIIVLTLTVVKFDSVVKPFKELSRKNYAMENVISIT
jgi:hypothetical protein